MLSPILIWSAIAGFAGFGLLIAWRATRENTGTAEDYYLGNRRFGGMVAGLSYAATTYSAFMLVVLTGLTYRGGIGALGFELIYFAGLGLLVIFAPRFWLAAKRWGFISPAEMLGARYGSRWVARAAALVALVFLMPYCTTQMAGIGLLLSGVTGGEITLTQAVATGALLAALWTLFAGIRSVAWTDAVQAVVMMGSAVLAILFAVAALGGWGAFAQATLETHGSHLSVPGPGLWSLGTFTALSLPWFFFAISNPQVSQRLFILKDMAAMRRMIFWVLGFGLAFTLIAVIWGFAALQLAPGLENTATATPALLTSGAIPAPVAVLLILGILAAAVSTLDSIALTLAAMVARDVMTDAPPRAQILTGRVVVILVILFASLFAVQKATVVDQLAALSAAGLMVTVPATIGAFFWHRATAAGALASILGGAALAVWMAMVQGVSVFNPVLALSVGGLSLGLFVLVSLVTRPRPEALDFAAELRPDLDRVNAW
ncbi:sodium:solute symporter family protein [Pararhodobacter aggregans]|uniref:Pantothenate permease n=1 Tax=Pararhodobacter aggregans TaxID=404875 RepID=A0A2T7UW06_9RHOB|nr:sodium:solute symporter family protein [Pararhodobacter aggregans]PTW99533.1 SSS family solute:Na+ symporter [Pararhodobacter aggregans]PVE48862.1 pantothenate permease [Pararhodobacter aggregans]